MANKKTFMLINAMQRAEGEDHACLMGWIEKIDYDQQEKIKAVTSIYNKLGIDKLALQKVESYYDEALRALNEVHVSEERKTALKAYADMMLKRNK